MPDEPGGAYDHLIDAEREALSRSGRPVARMALVKALREASGLGPREARDAVGAYLGRRDGRIPSGPDRPAGWIDDLLDAERAAALREDRPLTRILLIKALRGASGLGSRDARRTVEDYLRRKGGEGLGSGRGDWRVALVILVLIAAAMAFLFL